MVSLPRWKQVLCSFAGVLFLVGIGMKSVLFFRDGLMGTPSGHSTRLLDPAPDGKWPGPGPGVTDVPSREPAAGAEAQPPGVERKNPGSEKSTVPPSSTSEPAVQSIDQPGKASPATAPVTGHEHAHPDATGPGDSPESCPCAGAATGHTSCPQHRSRSLRGAHGLSPRQPGS